MDTIYNIEEEVYMPVKIVKIVINRKNEILYHLEYFDATGTKHLAIMQQDDLIKKGERINA